MGNQFGRTVLETRQARKATWIRGANLWRVGFHADALEAINWMSGLIEVLDVMWYEEEQILLMVVSNYDRSGTLFKTGSLRATHIRKYKINNQPLMVGTTWRSRRKGCGPRTT